jgi:hypothetical protein
MRNFIRLFIIICVFLVFNTNSFAAINKGRLNRGKLELSSTVGLYHGELTIDYSRAWDNPIYSYRVLKNELGLDINYKIYHPYSRTHRRANYGYYLDVREFLNTADLCFNINNRDFIPGGKTYFNYFTTIWNGSEGTASSSPELVERLRKNKIIIPYRTNFLSLSPEIKTYNTNSKLLLNLIIIDYLWDNPDGRLNNNPNDRGREHRKRREPIGRFNP